MRYSAVLKHSQILERPWEMAAAIIKRRANLDTPEKEIWFAVLVQAIRDIGSKYHSKDFWEAENLKLYCSLLEITTEYIYKTLRFIGYEVGALL